MNYLPSPKVISRGAASILLSLLSLHLISSATAQPNPSPSTATTSEAEEAIKLNVFSVSATGTNIRGVEPTGTAVIGISRSEIVSSGVLTTEALIKTNPAISNFQSLFPGNGDAGGSLAPSIHGVSEGETLVLINGHRLPGSGFLVTAADPTAVSPSAIQRMDIIPDGASAVYGSDAIEGVINIILRQDFKGVEASARYGFGDKYSNYNFDALAGQTWSGGSFLLSYDYMHSDALHGRDRSYFRQDRRAFGGADTRSQRTNVVTDANGVSLNSGTLLDLATFYDAIPETKRHNLVAAFNQKLSDFVSVYAEGFFEKRNAEWKVPLSNLTVSVPSTNPYVPTSPYAGAKAPLTATYFPGVATNTSKADVYSFSTGGKVKLPADWVVSLDSTYGESKSKALFPDVNAEQAQLLANNTTIGTALNPFGLTPDNVFAQVVTSVDVNPDVKQRLFDNTLKVDGSIYKLPGGEIKAAIGLGYRNENYTASNRAGALSNPLVGHADVTRNVSAVFGEFLVPIVGKDNELPGIRRLNFSLSARADHYSDFGDTTNPKFGATWSVFKGLDLRGSWGTSFHAPRLSDIGTGVDTRLIPFNFYLFGNTYPAVFGSTPPTNMVIIAGGTTGLKPEKATTWSTGFDFKPAALEGLKVSATFYNIVFKDNVSVVFLPDFNNPGDTKFWKANLTVAETQKLYSTFPQIPGASYPTQIQYLADVRRFNLGTIWTNGVDTDLSYRWNIATRQHVEAGVAANFITRRLTQQTEGAPITNTLDTSPGTGTGIRNRVRGRFSWNYTQYNAAVYLNRTEGYRDTGNPGRRVNPFTTLDLHLGCDLKGQRWLEGTSVALDFTNLLNTAPPFVNASNDNRTSAGTGVYGYDQSAATPLGRVISVTVRKNF